MADTNERKAKMIEMLNNGCSYSEIGKEFKLSRQRVHRILYPIEVDRLLEKAKAEVASRVLEEIQKEIEAALESNYKARNERNESRQWNRINDNFINTVNGKISALRGINDFIIELKKKYTREGTTHE